MTTDLREYVARSRAAQGLPPTVKDPATLERAAAALRLMVPQTDQRHRPKTRTA